uniref:Centriolar coiled-coil protein of 110 kDa n=1 Tax=Stomoxys calcitrans TaxID=35570 RepID=A0A1I8PG26_STOCA
MDIEANGTAGTNAKVLQRKYVSVFRIDGEPIIPPLMTTEKVRQMQKLKEKALKIEQRLKERKLRFANKENDGANAEVLLCETSRSSIAADSLSHRSQDLSEANRKATEESMMLLQDIIRRQSGESEDHRAHGRVSQSPKKQSNDEKLRKLQKSETLIYDNSKNEVIKQIQNLQDSEEAAKQRPTSINSPPKKPNFLLLASLNEPCIPSICINPPTPLVGNRQFGEQLDATRDLQDSDDSLSSMYTHSDRRQPPPVPERTYITKLTRSGKIHDLKIYNTAKNVSTKVQQYEVANSDQSSYVATPNSSPDKVVSKKVASINTMNRSATSPSIKLNMEKSCLNASNNSHISPDNSLVRSSSFTLEAPSKALIEHMRQQRSSSRNKTSNGQVNRTPPSINAEMTRKSPTISRVHRDTVESKAKRVQKVDLKPARQKILPKASQQKLAQAAVASIAPYKSNSSSYATHGSTSNLYKTKRSPYDPPISYTKSSPLQTKARSSSQVRKSPTPSVASTTSQRPTMKSSVSKSTIRSPPNLDKDALNQMDKEQKEKFVRLLRQQEEEQRKLKQAFEMQQKLLIEQLNKEMASSQLNSPPSDSSRMGSSRPASTLTQHSENSNDQSSSASPDSPQQCSTNRQYSQKILPHTNENNLPSTGNVGHHTTDYSQVPSLTLSNLSSIDHSNANISLESSSLYHGCDQSTYRTDTTITPEENAHKHSMGAGASSASRRRLFPQEHNATAVPTSTGETSMRPFNTVSSNNHRLMSDLHKGTGTVAISGSNSNGRREIEQINRANAAATIINAYARGFLVRRLFKTEQIQRIVQTIHDTLIFVLNLHMETCENPEEGNTPANIKLKARLLQQLSSATHTLHLVLFQTSVNERMEIIARDRKRIKHKLMAMSRNSTSRRTPRIAG